ncbi:ATP-binding cassette domain-containing protein [Caldisericum exile]|uniref:Iron-sulfur cluster assembly protein SufC n=1 Tax=Caldisericum exile (strain DSM 21853 / NBRC 104410 / AZM16c01) TaxID=511051 RepID=A0A7U6JFQ0_CALEA|nr:ABC transporter ATP-binding protein [Caldisericum exile]BAL80435.1 putative iron-sulfur cluster assembly protein SufC [Caldisericum exile AZM16c01]
MLKLENISYIADNKLILRDISMEFEEGKKYAILGVNGAGKSTLGYIIMGLEDYKPTSGRIFLDNEDITSLSIYERSKRGITLVFQEPPRFEGISISAYLTLGGKLKVERKEIENILATVGLNPKLYIARKVNGSLSGGERKRVELASILVLKPRYAILDEPDSGIDIMSLEMVNNVLSYIASYGGTPIIITHREEMATNVDYAYHICNGIVLHKGDALSVIEEYKKECGICNHPNAPERNEQLTKGGVAK